MMLALVLFVQRFISSHHSSIVSWSCSTALQQWQKTLLFLSQLECLVSVKKIPKSVPFDTNQSVDMICYPLINLCSIIASCYIAFIIPSLHVWKQKNVLLFYYYSTLRRKAIPSYWMTVSWVCKMIEWSVDQSHYHQCHCLQNYKSVNFQVFQLKTISHSRVFVKKKEEKIYYNLIINTQKKLQACIKTKHIKHMTFKNTPYDESKPFQRRHIMNPKNVYCSMFSHSFKNSSKKLPFKCSKQFVNFKTHCSVTQNITHINTPITHPWHQIHFNWYIAPKL